MAFNIVTKNTVRDRFKSAPRPAIWKDTDDKDWNNWIWQQQKRIKSMEQLEQVLLPPRTSGMPLRARTRCSHGHHALLRSLMDRTTRTARFGCSRCHDGELNILPTDWEDPLQEERDMPVPGITHRYPDRVLFYTTHNCPVYCRHCTRKRKVSDPSSSAANKQLEDA